MTPPPWGFFALVSYVPDPLGASLDDLRLSLPGVEFQQAHITILPPRPLHVPIESATRFAQHVLGQFTAFEVELSAVRRFPSTNVLYLDLASGSHAVRRLHDALNMLDLSFAEPFPFHPHLTLGGPVPAGSVDSLQAQAEKLWRSIASKRHFNVREIIALWAGPGDEALAWKRLWSYHLHVDQSQIARV